jgi:7,8-dihydropterin-6-yl-methyl-4-(beta-D-ribofuranosyl)aminobenzene 5'-phosphate synthase
MSGADRAGEVQELDELELVVVVDNETDSLSSVDDGLPQVPEMFRLAGRLPRTEVCDGHSGWEVFDHMCCACHGLSVLATARRGDESRTMLFDVGPYPKVWLDNAEHLGIDLASIECIFLSHWHFDHSGGFPDVVAAVAAARASCGRDPVVVDLHPDRPDQRGIQIPTGDLILLSPEPTFEAIAAAGGVVRKNAEDHPLCDGLLFGSGTIERVTEYERGLAGHMTFRGGAATPDPLIMDERFLAARVRGRGVTVLSACSHAGVVNACLDAQRRFPGQPIDAVLGGYHLAGKAMEARIPETVRDLRERIRPRILAPGHCTGWRAKAALADAFAPGRYAPSVVGSTYRLAAEAVQR